MKKLQIIDSFTLKIIALVSMFIDHFAATLFTHIVDASYSISEYPNAGKVVVKVLEYIQEHYIVFENVIMVMRLIGRIAFPIYCFLLVEGFTYTKCKWKYALRLLIFAFISELPFDMAFNGINHIEFEFYNNVFFTLFIGLMLIWGLSSIVEVKSNFYKKYIYKSEEKVDDIVDNSYDKGVATTSNMWLYKAGIEMLYIIVLVILFICAYYAIDLCASDYGIAGIICIFAMYKLRKYKIWAFIIGALLICIASLNLTQIFALFGVIPICMYNGKKGRTMKWFFYIFYPAHLLILVMISILIGVYSF